ncbi:MULTISPECIES: STAS domain-containing protein [Aliagarivorans]|uniref:STAS domain-containing protein n=1 Tax=Aliagarivorans TaxID=882379 RepID=UPI0003F8C4A9|nr:MULTISPECIES: STAS domain-containing protein [Aliagarivorans]
MSIQSRLNSEDGELVITVEGRFDYSKHQDFRCSYKDQAIDGMLLVLDLSAAEYMDSSALGMMLLLKEHAEKSQARDLVIRRPSPAILKVLEVANFDKLIKIES